MKVVHITTMDFGGAGMAVIRIHEALLNLGIDSKILVLTKITDTPGVVSYLPKNTNKYIQCVLNRIENLQRLLWEYRNPIVREFKKKYVTNDCVYSLPLSPYSVEKHPLVKYADVIHLHWIQNFVNYPTFFSKVNKPIIWTGHDLNIIMGGFHHLLDKKLFYGKYKEIEDRLVEIKRRNLKPIPNGNIIFLSQMIREQVGSCDLFQTWKSQIIHNMVDPSVFSLHERAQVRQQLSLPLEKRIILFVAYDISDENKGLNTLCEALKQLDDNSILLCTVGGNNKNILIDYPHISMGHIAEPKTMSMVYSASDLCVLASKQEAFAQTPLESIASGTPVVVTPCSGTEELINDNNGVRCGDFSEEELARCIKMAINKSYDPQIMRQDIIERFSPEHIAQQYIDLYLQMMGEQ